MTVKHKTSCGENVSNLPGTSTAFQLAGTAATGFLRTIAAAYSNTDQLPYFATNGTDFESGIGTFATGSPNTLTRTTILESSNANAAVNFSGGAAVSVWVDWPASIGQSIESTMQSAIPGGRLTLTSGLPVTTADVIGATTIYYTPYVHNVVNLWDGNFWRPTVFAETSLALGTLTSGLVYDVFAYLSSGVLALELLAWTSATARATAITLQDGRYCKSGDKTRLYLGSFATTSTTTVENSAENRLIWNMYNRESASCYKMSVVSHTYSSGTPRVWGNVAAYTSVNFLNGLAESITVNMSCQFGYTGGGSLNAVTGIYIDSSSVFSDGTGNHGQISCPLSALVISSIFSDTILSAGLHTAAIYEEGLSGAIIFYEATLSIRTLK